MFNIILIILIIIGILFSIYIHIYKNTNYHIPKKIWTYWDENPPNNVIQIYKYHKKTLKSWDIELLNNETIYNYIDKKEFPENYSSLVIQSRADWIRLYLLNKYGGLWIDSTIIINSENELNNLYNRSYWKRSEFSGFSYRSDIKDNILTYIENWFIMSPINSPLITKWYNEYTYAINIGFLNYKKELKYNKIHIDKRIYDLNDDKVYFTMHACMQKILRVSGQPNMIIMKAEDSAFKLMDLCEWDAKCMRNRMKYDISTKESWIIKLIKHVRVEINDLSFFFN